MSTLKFCYIHPNMKPRDSDKQMEWKRFCYKIVTHLSDEEGGCSTPSAILLR